MLLLLSTIALSAEIDGSWVLDETPAEVEARHAEALDKGLASLTWAFRPIAKPFLKGSVRSCTNIDLDVEGTAFRAKCDDRPPLKLDLSEPNADFIGEDGGKCTVKTSSVEDGLQVSFHCERGGQHNWYRKTDSGLEITRELFSPQLPTPIRWTVRYRSE